MTRLNLAKTTIGLFETEKIHREGPWRSLSEVELATLEWVGWYKNERSIPPAAGVLPLKWKERINNNNELLRPIGLNETRNGSLSRSPHNASPRIVCRRDGAV